MFDDLGLRARYIRGEDNRENVNLRSPNLPNKDIDVLIGTTILDVGVDVPAVGLIILAGGGKAEVALRQRIGRGLRARNSVQTLRLLLISQTSTIQRSNLTLDSVYRSSEKHPALAENIVANFEFEKLGFKKAA
ncbi:helicase-related protein [Acinetobacter baumannii]|uniref:helicase-related protein n=1 Tax=Acinetobacter baumannii TaxID=470 RepID=UPI003D052206